jgi:pentatricopeptide repeat protein
MPTGLVIYYSRSGNTEQMAQIFSKSMSEAGLRPSANVSRSKSPTSSMPTPSSSVPPPTTENVRPDRRAFVSRQQHSKLDGIGAAFASANIGGGTKSPSLIF